MHRSDRGIFYANVLPKADDRVGRMLPSAPLPPPPLPNVPCYLCFLIFLCFCFCPSHIGLINCSSLNVSCQTHSWWSLEYLLWRAFQLTSTQQTLSCMTMLREAKSSKASLEDWQLMCRISSPLGSTLLVVAPTPASSSLHQVSTNSIVVVYSSLVCHQ